MLTATIMNYKHGVLKELKLEVKSSTSYKKLAELSTHFSLT